MEDLSEKGVSEQESERRSCQVPEMWGELFEGTTVAVFVFLNLDDFKW